MNQAPTASHGCDIQISSRNFRLFSLLLSVWLLVGTGYLYRQELSVALGLWDNFNVNGENYSRFVDSRDSSKIFQNQLTLIRQGQRSGALFVGPSNLYSRNLLPIDSSKSYQMSLEVMTIADGTDDKGSPIYAGLVFYDKDRKIIAEPQSHMFGVAANYIVTRAVGRRNLSGIFSPIGHGANRIPENARYMKIAIAINYGNPKAAAILSNVRFAQYSADGENK